MAKVLEDIVIETICYLFNKKMADDLNIEVPELEARICFHISTVSHFRESSEDGEILQGRCMVYFHAGDTCLIGMSYDDMNEKYTRYHTQK